MVLSGEPDNGTEDMLSGRKLVASGPCFDRLKAQEKAGVRDKLLFNPGRSMRFVEIFQSRTKCPSISLVLLHTLTASGGRIILDTR